MAAKAEASARDGLRARPRLLLALACGAGAGLAAALVPALRGEWVLLPMIAWSGVCASWIVSVWLMLRKTDYECTRRMAEREDDGRRTSRTLLTTGALVSLLGVAFALYRAHELSAKKDPMEYVVTAIGVLTVALTWTLVHMENMLHYARLYYDGDDGGVDFHTEYAEGDGPTYRDFAYLAFTVGMTFQVSDTEITDPRIRHAILHHAVLSYLFGTVLVALTINGLASLVS